MTLRTACYGGFLLLLLSGCGPATAGVSGKVTYAGEPVARGTIAMLSDDGRVAQSPIKDGIYSIVDAPVGHVVVAINGGDPVPPLPPATRPEQYAEMKKKELEKLKKDLAEGKIKELPKEPLIVPLQYDDTKRSGLSFEVKPGKQTHNFDLPRLPEEEKEKPK